MTCDNMLHVDSDEGVEADSGKANSGCRCTWCGIAGVRAPSLIRSQKKTALDREELKYTREVVRSVC